MTMIFDLPMDLIEEIISRTPLKSTRAVRLTCKKWNALSKIQRFSKMHLVKAAAATKEAEYMLIVLMEYNLHLMSVTVNENPTTQLEGKLVCLDEQVKIFRVFQCEGLLLCILKDDTRIVVWNPYLGQTRWIVPRYSKYKNTNRYALGYVNHKNKSCRTHKILRFLGGRVYEIYDFNSGLWKTLDVTQNWHMSSSHLCGVSLKGNTYWCAIKDDRKYDNYIICFDFTRERFGPLMHLPFSVGRDNNVTLSCVREEKLAVLLTHGEINPYEIEIWITTKIEFGNVMWSKLLTLNTKPDYPFSCESFFVDEEKKFVMGFDDDSDSEHHILSIVGEAGKLRQLEVREEAAYKHLRNTRMCSFVPSLVQIK